MKIVKRIVMAGMLALALAACGGGGGGGGEVSGTQTVTADGENLAFSTTSMTVPSGQVTVNFNNTSTANQHNWVLVNGGDDVAARVDEASIAASDNGYIPETPDVLAHTELLDPGQSGSASFAAPPAGTYTYICTVPGHYAAGMKGTLTVQ